MAPSLPENEVAVAIDYSQLLPIDTAGYALVENLEDKNLDKLMPVSKHRSRTMAGIESAPILAGTVRKTSSSGNLGLLLPAAVAPAPYLAPERSGNWQIGLRFGAFFGNNAEYLTYYTTMPNNTTQDQIYLFPSGDTLHLFFAGAVVEKRWRVEVPLLQLDLHRVTASGLGFRLGLTYSIIQSDDTRRTQLIPRRPGIFYYSRESKNVFWAAELGLTYTFNRPKRFQPHVGLSAFAIFSQSSNATTTAFFPDQTYELVESRYRSVSNRLLYGYYWNFGIQWFLDDRFSIGPNFTFTGLPGATSMTIGGGVEARYRW